MCEQVPALVVSTLVSVLAAGPQQPRLSITGHRAAVVGRGGQVGIEVGVTVQSWLSVPVSEIEIGILYATDPKALSGVDPVELYGRGTGAVEGVGVLVKRLLVELRPRSEAAATFVHSVPADGPAPKLFQTHLLGYTLADASASLLTELLATSAASDEVAACRAFALLGDASAKSAARRRWSGRGDLVTALARQVLADLPEKLGQEEAFTRVYAVLALGVLGGEEASQALATLARDPNLGRLDEPLQVLRVARLVGSAKDTPLAFALSPEARTMGGVVAAALADLEGLSSVAPQPQRVGPAPATTGVSEAKSRTADPSCSARRAGVLGGAVAMLPAVWIAMRWRQRRR